MDLDKDVAAIADQLASFFRLPFATESIPGGFAEALIADHYKGEVLATYDFVDVICRENRIGWQVKSTKATTPVTWKRAKIEGSVELIHESDLSGDTSVLGAKIIETCNEHVQDSLDKYDLREIRYARIISCPGRFTYFERSLVSRSSQALFDPTDFSWEWSKPKRTGAKEQLRALHGFRGDDKWFAWHGRGENQLHFSGEKNWWPDVDPGVTAVTRPKYGQQKSWPELISWLNEDA